jgi:hypothetical protein
MVCLTVALAFLVKATTHDAVRVSGVTPQEALGLGGDLPREGSQGVFGSG